MTTNWSQFPIGNVEPKDSTNTAHPITPVTTNLNLTDLAPHDSSLPAKTANSGTVLDFGAGFVGGVGKQAWGTATSLVGADASKAMDNLKTGRNDGYSFLSVAGTFASGLSKTVSVAYHNPDALLKLPGQIISNYQNGNMETKGDIVGQASFIVGSFFVGGAGASKAAKVGGDLSEAATAAKGFDAISQTAAAATKLETAVRDVGTIGRLSDFSALTDAGKIGRVGDFSALTDAAKIGRVGDFSAAADASAILGKTGSWSSRALPMENPTAFLSPTSRAGSLGVSEGLSTRVMSTFRGEGSNFGNLAAKFTPVSEGTSSLATRLSQNLTTFGRQVEGSGAAAEHLLQTPVAEGLGGNLVREGAGGLTTGLLKDTGVVGGKDLGVLGKGAYEGFLSKVTPHFDGLSAQTDILKTSASATSLEARSALTEFEQTLTRFKTATTEGSATAADRLQYMQQLDRNVAALERAGLDTGGIRQNLQLLHIEMNAGGAAAMGSGLVATRLAPHFDVLTSETAAIKGGATSVEARTAVSQFENSVTSFKTAVADGTLSSSERMQQFAQMDRNVVALENAGVNTTGVKQALTALRTESQLAETGAQMKNVSTAAEALQVSAASKPMEVQKALQAVQESSTHLAGPLNTADRASQLASLERNMAIVDRAFGSEADALRGATSGLKVELETAQRAAQIETTVARLPEQARVIGSTLDGLEAQALAKGPEATGAVTNLREATAQLSTAATAAQRTEQLMQIDRSMVVLERELGPNAALNSAVEELRVGSQSIDRLSRIEQAVTAVPTRASSVLEETAALRTVSSSTDVQTALANIEKSAIELRQPLSVVDRTEQMVQLQRSMGVIESLGPEAAPLRNAVAGLQSEVSTAQRLSRLETAVSELPTRSNALTDQLTQLRQLAADSPQMANALDGIEQASAKLSKPITAAEHAEALVQMDKNVSLVEAKFGTQAAGLRTAATDLTSTSATVERLGRLDTVVSTLPAKFESVAAQSTALEAAAAAKGAHVSDALAAVRESSTQLASGSVIDRAEQMARLEKNFAVVDRELGSEAAGLRQSVYGVQNELQTAERLTRIESAASELPMKSKALTEGISEIRQLAGGTQQTQQALDAIEQASAKLSRPLTATEHAEALVQMEKNVAVVETHFGAEAVQLRTAATEFGSTTATVERLGRLDAAFTEMPVRLENVAREGAGLEVAAAAKGTHVSEALAAVQQSSSELAMGNVANRAEQMARLEQNMAIVDRELGAQAAGFKESVFSLQNEVKTADRLAQIEFGASQATRQAENISENLSLFRTANSVVEGSEADVALKNLRAGADHVLATDGLADAQRMSQMRSDLAVVERTFGAEAAAPLRESFLQMETQSANASRLVNLDQALAQVAERSIAVGDEAALFKNLVRTADAGVVDVAKAEAVRAEATTSAVADATNAERVAATRTSEAVVQADGAVRDTAALKAAAASDSDTALANLERNSKTLSTTVDTTERAQQIAQMNRDLTAVEAYYGREATVSLRESVLKLENASAATDRLAAFESASTQFIKHSEAVAAETEVLAATAKASNAEAAVAGINKAAAEAAATTDATVRAEQIARMNQHLAAAEQELGAKATASLQTSVARMESQAGTIDRLSLVDATASQVPARGEAVAQQLTALRATTNSAEVEAALANISRGAMEAASPATILSRADQLSARGADLGVIEKELGTPAAGNVRTALAELDRATAAARASQLELVNYQGAKITQGLGYVESAGNIGSYQQIQRLEQINHDLAVMKSVIPVDSSLMQPIAQVEQHLKAVDAVSNILAHKDVARASVNELLALVHSTDSAVATAAADRLVLKGKTAMVESPVTGLMTERQHLWQAHKEYAALNAQVEQGLFESGKLFGLQTSDPAFKRVLADIALATTGIGFSLGNAGYNLNVAAAAARDNVLSAQYSAQKNQEGQAEQLRQAQGAAANAAQSSSSQTNSASTTVGTASSGNLSAPQAVPEVARTTQGQLGSGQEVARAGQGQLGSVQEVARVSAGDQAVFKPYNDASRVGPAITVFGTPTYQLASNDFPVNGTPSSWWLQQHGGNVWGFARGPGAVSAGSESTVLPLTPQFAKAVPIATTKGSDLTKIATTQFSMPRATSLTSQNSLLINPVSVGGRDGRSGVGVGGTTGGATTVDWSQFVAQRVGRNEGSSSNRRGHDLHQLSGMEKGEESIDAAAGSAAAPVDPDQHLSAQVNDPNYVKGADPNQTAPQTVASTTNIKQDDQGAVTV